jgi:hypothetical protein
LFKGIVYTLNLFIDMRKGIVFLSFLMLLQLSANAQLSKEEQKEWAKKLKSLTPEQYKKLSDDNQKLSAELNTAKQEEAKLNDALKAKEAEIAALKAKDSAKAVTAPSNTQATTKSSGESSTSGLVYKVQIGSFKNKDLSKYFDNNKNFSGEVDADGTKKYTLGAFTDYWEADNFKKYLREMGVEDAWIVAYKNGQRISLKEARETDQ